MCCVGSHDSITCLKHTMDSPGSMAAYWFSQICTIMSDNVWKQCLCGNVARCQHTRWLIEDFMSLLPLRMAPKKVTPLGIVDVTYTQELSLMNFVENRYVLVSYSMVVTVY